MAWRFLLDGVYHALADEDILALLVKDDVLAVFQSAEFFLNLLRDCDLEFTADLCMTDL